MLTAEGALRLGYNPTSLSVPPATSFSPDKLISVSVPTVNLDSPSQEASNSSPFTAVQIPPFQESFPSNDPKIPSALITVPTSPLPALPGLSPPEFSHGQEGLTPPQLDMLRLPRSRGRFVDLDATCRLLLFARLLRRPWGSGSPGPNAA